MITIIDSDSLYVVYAAINSANGKMYIGATEKGLWGRESRHATNAKRGQISPFYAAMRKYGRDAFHWFVIHECEDFFHALEWERFYITKYKPEYNLTDGGGGVKGLKFSAESRAKMSAAKKGKPGIWARQPMPVEIRTRLAAQRRAERGMKRSAAAMLAMQQNSRTANEARRRKVVCLDTGTVFNSVTDAAHYFNTTTGNITHWCNGMPSRKGIKVSYLDGPPPL